MSAWVLERQIVFHSAAAQAALLILIASENKLSGGPYVLGMWEGLSTSSVSEHC